MAEKDRAEEIKKAANELAQANNCDVMLINGDIYSALQDELIAQIKSRVKKKASLAFIMATPGGSPDCAYRLSRAIQNNYQSTTAIVAGWCKSAGTLCVIGATEVVMSDDAELGPLDVQIARRDELGERDSGLVLSEAFINLEMHAFSLFENFLLKIKERSEGAITFKTATEISTAITKGLFEAVYRQIDPQRIGEAARSLAISEAYGSRLNVWAKNLKPIALSSMTVGYPSHGFVIDRREAGELFKRVREPNSYEKALIEAIGYHAEHPGKEPVVCYLNSEGNENEAEQQNDATKGNKKKNTGTRGTPSTRPRRVAR